METATDLRKEVQIQLQVKSGLSIATIGIEKAMLLLMNRLQVLLVLKFILTEPNTLLER